MSVDHLTLAHVHWTDYDLVYSRNPSVVLENSFHQVNWHLWTDEQRVDCHCLLKKLIIIEQRGQCYWVSWKRKGSFLDSFDVRQGISREGVRWVWDWDLTNKWLSCYRLDEVYCTSLCLRTKVVVSVKKKEVSPEDSQGYTCGIEKRETESLQNR